MSDDLSSAASDDFPDGIRPYEGALSDEPILITVEARAHGWRLDHYLCRLFPNYSRALFQKAIHEEAVHVNGLPAKSARRLRINDRIAVRLPKLPDSGLTPENIPLEIIYEDDYLAVVNKPANMIVHPGRGNYSGTLAAALQFHFDSLSDVAGQYRAGIVHRLDRDTSGVLVIARDNQVHHKLSAQFERREVKKEYHALTWGRIHFDSDYIETYMRMHPRQREKMCVCEPGGDAREASTFYEVIERFRDISYVRLLPRTGRTHQLRVHMQHIGHPIVADKLYGGRVNLKTSDLTPQADRAGRGAGADAESEILIARQALHAFRLEFRHPQSGNLMRFEAPLADDFQRTLDALRRLERDA